MKAKSAVIFTLVMVTFLCLPQQGKAQLYYKARTLTTADGLSDNRVTCFHKDKKGFMWIGTRNGLNRYDGHAFKIYRPAPGNSISNEIINDIAEDPQGRIWVATMEGLNIFDPQTGRWEVMMPSEKDQQNDLPNYIVWDLWFDTKGLLWIASDVFEFSSYDPDRKKFTYYNWPAFARATLNTPGLGRYNSIQQFAAINDHLFWLGTTKGLVQLDIRNGQFTYLGGGYYSDVNEIRYDAARQRVYLSVQGGNAFVYDAITKKYSPLSLQQQPYPSSTFSRPSADELWLASEEGLIRIAATESRLMKHIPHLSGSLLPGSVNTVFAGAGTMRWVGTSNGVSVYDLGLNQAAFLPLLNSSDKEAVNHMGGAYYDAPGASYFVCTINPAGVYVINSRTGSIKRITADNQGNPLPPCIQIKADREGQLWLLTEASVYRYDRAAAHFVLFPLNLTGVKDPVFRDMVDDGEGHYWFSAFNRNIICYEKKTGGSRLFTDTVLKYTNTTTGLALDTVNKKIFIGTFGSYLYVFDMAAQQFTWYYETTAARQYAKLNMINDIITDNRGRVWIATYSGGVFRYEHNQPYEKSFSGVDMRHGLDNNNIISMCSDADSTLWLLTGNGISAMSASGRFLYRLNDQEFFSFSSYSADPRYQHSISFNPVNNEIMTTAGGGLLLYHTKQHDTALKIPVVITELNVDGTQQPLQALLKPGRYKSIFFSFAGLYYGNLRSLRYEYKLSGYDKDWQQGDKSFSAKYQNLPGGAYRFQARVVDEAGAVKGESEVFSFTIRPPFWNTGWFWSLVLLLAGMAVFAVVFSLQRKLKEEQLINAFATSLYSQHTVDDIFWDIARNCIERIGFSDCVIYLHDEQRRMLLQRAAVGPKNPARREILNPIEIPVGKGIVGAVAQTGKAEIIGNTTRDPRYIIDDEKRLSEITVPVIIDKRVFAVIDSEHPRKYFYTRYHLRLLKKVAALCAERIARYLAGEKIRAKIARDLHDEMGSTLTSINITSKVAMQEGMQQEKVNYYLQKIKDNSGRMMESMSDIVWAINPANDSFEKVLIRMKEFAAELLEPAKIGYRFTEEGALVYARLNLEQRKNLYMIFKEAINNVVKYSGASFVDIQFSAKNNTFIMQLYDNGRGFDAAASQSGNGLKNMQDRAGEMKAVLLIESAPGKGTAVKLEAHLT